MNKFILIFFLLISTVFAQSVVINKFFNSGQSSGQNDVIELLVIEKDLDMRGMIIKDFSSSMNGDNGGKYQFKDVDLWSKLPSGTLIIIRVQNFSNDTDTSDFVIDVGLKDTTYFIQVGTGTFDIATTELVMIKSSGSDPSGVDGSIHCFGTGTAGTFFNQAAEPKLRTNGTSGTGKFAFAKNSNSLISDFNGNDADTTSSPLVFGEANTESNRIFISNLRGGSTTVKENVQRSYQFILFDNYPNPFNPSTKIKFVLERDSEIMLKVFNILGNTTQILYKGYLTKGEYTFDFDSKNLPSGIYYYQLKTEFGTKTKKMILAR